MKKRVLSILLVFVMLFTLTGCNQEEQKEGEYQVYSELRAEIYQNERAEQGIGNVVELAECYK